MGPQQQSIPSMPHIPLLQKAAFGAKGKDHEMMSLNWQNVAPCTPRISEKYAVQPVEGNTSLPSRVCTLVIGYLLNCLSTAGQLSKPLPARCKTYTCAGLLQRPRI